MAPPSNRKGVEKVVPVGDASDATTTDGVPGCGGVKVRHTESEQSSTEIDEELRKMEKIGSPMAKTAAATKGAEAARAVGSTVVTDVGTVVDDATVGEGGKKPMPRSEEGRSRRKAITVGDLSAADTIEEMQEIGCGVMDLLHEGGATMDVVRRVLMQTGK